MFARARALVCLCLWLCLCLVAVPRPAGAERVKDLASLMGARSNQLLGYGLVVGLAQTGDDFYSGIGMQSVATMLRRLGVNVDPKTLYLRNVAAVMITADLPAFVGPGQRLDVTVSSIGNARSLEGGTLVSSPLKGADLKVYAVAQGALSVGGFYVGGRTGSRLQKNITTVGRIPGGALVEREVPATMPEGKLTIALHQPDFTTAVSMATAIAARVGEADRVAPAPAAAPAAAPGAPAADPNAAAPAPPAAAADPNAPPAPWAVARDSGTIEVRIPPGYAERVPELMAALEALDVRADWLTRVVVNERTGTVVLGDAVRLAPVAIAHGGLTLEVKEEQVVSQPNLLARGNTVTVPQSAVGAREEAMNLKALSPGASLGEVVKALNTLGVLPRDMVSILQALKTSGALRADLEIQ